LFDLVKLCVEACDKGQIRWYLHGGSCDFANSL
jgi:hypothetical protein